MEALSNIGTEGRSKDDHRLRGRSCYVYSSTIQRNVEFLER